MTANETKRAYVHDIEISPNFFSDIFFDLKTDPKLIQEYIKADYEKRYEDKLKFRNMMNPKVFIIYNNDTSQIPRMMKFLRTKVSFLIGFNSAHFDDVLLKYLFIKGGRFHPKENVNELLFEVSNLIFDSGDTFNNDLWQIKKTSVPFVTLDVFQIAFAKIQRKSLKQTLIKLNWYRIQDLPYKPGQETTDDMVDAIIDYEFNDVLGTLLMYNKLKKDISLRLKINERYNVNVLNKSRSGIGDVMFFNFYLADNPDLTYQDLMADTFRTHRDWIRLSECVSDNVTFKGASIRLYKNHAKPGRKEDYKLIPTIQTFSDLLILIKKTNVQNTNAINFRIMFDGTIYDLKSGGLHSVDEPTVHEETEEYEIIDADVGSFYPAIIVNEKIKPKHLRSNFITRFAKIMDDRLLAKHRGDKVEADNLKIVINAWYGKFKSIFSPLYDIKCTLSTTVNGQLFLLSLIERLVTEVKGLQVVSANTDGIVCKVPKGLKAKYLEVCAQWEKDTNFTLEYTYYTKYVCRDVNNYTVLKKTDDELTPETLRDHTKNKGVFDWDNDDMTKGFNPSIIPIALRNYFFLGIPITKTMADEDDIYKFCLSQKVDKNKFNPIVKEIVNGQLEETYLQLNNRFFISTKGGYLFKDYKEEYDYQAEKFVKPHSKPRLDKKGSTVVRLKKPIGIVKEHRVTILNDYFPVAKFSDYNVDYEYYIKQCQEIIDKIERKEFNLFNYE